ncbi:MAG: hypothetical protein K1X54_10105 [Flavobacteriales bacterium]|nr:hypothetical protein [Flavobacteriales bacterium]
MIKFSEKILDQFDEDRDRRWFEHWTVVYLPILLLIVGLLFRIQHWPFSSLLIASGLGAILIRNFIFFFSKSRSFAEWSYFVGRIFLVVTLILHFGLKHYSIRSIFIGLCVFATGALIYWLKREKKSDHQPEQIEDDF